MRGKPSKFDGWQMDDERRNPPERNIYRGHEVSYKCVCGSTRATEMLAGDTGITSVLWDAAAPVQRQENPGAPQTNSLGLQCADCFHELSPVEATAFYD